MYVGSIYSLMKTQKKNRFSDVVKYHSLPNLLIVILNYKCNEMSQTMTTA